MNSYKWTHCATNVKNDINSDNIKQVMIFTLLDGLDCTARQMDGRQTTGDQKNSLEPSVQVS